VEAPRRGDLPPEELRALARELADWISDYLERVGTLPVSARVSPGDVRAALPATPPEEGESMQDVLADFRTLVMPGITHWNHPAFFGYFANTGSGPGILAEMLTAALNANAMVWRSSPAATELEEVATDWLRALLGLPPGFEGVINDTASSSTLYALAAARRLAYPEVARRGLFAEPPGSVYASEHAHMSVERAVVALGLGREGYRTVAAGEDLGMSARALSAALAQDVAAGVRPVAIVATLGTTSSAAVDPVRRIAELAREHGVWLHVDAAYAGSAAIVPELRGPMAGWELADSIVVNPHKWLFTPLDCSVLFCSRPEDLASTFRLTPEYLRAPSGGDARDLMDYGLALGRRFRALKLWFVLRYFGREGLIERLRLHVRMAQELAGWIREEEGWELAAPQRFSLVAFRYAPAGASPSEVDALNLEILERVNASGEAFLTHTTLGGRVAIRVAIGNVRTTRDHVARTWALLTGAAAASTRSAEDD
jgi:aromatic-L-amino-acid/L-tryptophan decarboxylase